MEDFMARNKTVQIWLKKGTEVHGPNGWVSLLGNVSTEATKSVDGYEYYYTVRDEVWTALAGDVIEMRV
jgi:hypothetical protein